MTFGHSFGRIIEEEEALIQVKVGGVEKVYKSATLGGTFLLKSKVEDKSKAGDKSKAEDEPNVL